MNIKLLLQEIECFLETQSCSRVEVRGTLSSLQHLYHEITTKKKHLGKLLEGSNTSTFIYILCYWSDIDNSCLYLVSIHDWMIFSCYFNPLETGNFDDKFNTLVHDSHSTINNEESFLQGFLVILKRVLQNCCKILKNFFFGTTCTVIYSDMYI